ncbi:MAG TPA: serine hydrolase domain-containing protein [Acidimicrobiia bacterium]|nr:serine hydrolase domain-containing protein [Acidimicrobiia bacterium]
MRSRVAEILNRRPAVGLAMGVGRGGRLEFFHGHGLADIGSNTPVTEDTVFRIASITKTFTAIAVMQLWEKGLVDLDAPANDYLRGYKLIPGDPAWRPATVRHLLTHSAGLPEVAHLRGLFSPDFGEGVDAGQPLSSLGDFYKGGLRLYAEPGTRFVYNNHGPATLGQLVQDVTGEPLDRYFRGYIFEPLGMADSDLLRSERIRRRLATGYEIHSRGVKTVADRELVTAGAASIYSTPRDMSRYLAALLGGGSNEHGSVLKAGTLGMMFEAHYQPDSRIPGMGLGFFRKDISGHLAVRHQGTLPGFHSEICVVPDAGIGVMAFTNGASQPDFWLPAEVSGMLKGLIGLSDDQTPPMPQLPDLWEDLSGWYRLSARLSDTRLRAMMGAGVEVFVRGGRLMLRFLTPIPALAGGFPLQPDDAVDPYVFRIDPAEGGLEDPVRVVFGQDPGGSPSRLFFDLMPVTFEKQPDVTNPRKWTTSLLGGLAVAAAVSLFRRAGSR